MSNLLLIVDPQLDFCYPEGALYVDGAAKDMGRLCYWLKEHVPSIDQIAVTLDLHTEFDIAHPAYWEDANGNSPEPFTQIAQQDIIGGRFRTSDPALGDRALQYVKTLEINDRPGLTIRNYVRELPRLPKTMTVDQAIIVIQATRQPLGVVQEKGKALGIVSLPDLVRQLVRGLEA